MKRSCHFRYFILAIIFFVNVTHPLSCRNMIYAIQPMTNHSALEVQLDPDFDNRTEDTSSFGDTCHPPKTMNESRHVWLDGPHLFDNKRQALILSAVAVGQLFGTLFSLLIYDFCYLSPIMSIALFWSGLLNLFLPLIASKAGSVGVIISRFSIGLYMGMLTPANSWMCNNWFPPKEKDFVGTIINSGSNVGNTLFATAGIATKYLGWNSLFWIPGSLSILCSVLVFAFLTDDPSTSQFLSEEEKKGFMRQKTSRQEYNLAIDKKSNSAKFRPRSSFHKFNVAIARVSRRKPVPWFKVLGYLQFWALLAGVMAHSWACEATITYTQIYLTEIHNYSLSYASFLNTVP